MTLTRRLMRFREAVQYIMISEVFD